MALGQPQPPHPNIAFRIFNGFANFLDHLVAWLTRLFYFLKWTGTATLGTLIVLRFGGRKAALGTSRSPSRASPHLGSGIKASRRSR